MNRCLIVVLALALSAAAPAGQGKPVIVVQVFAAAPDVTLPYDLKLMRTQLVAELTVLLKEFDVVDAAPAAPHAAVYTLDGRITAWHPGNVAKRLVIGMGSGRESSDLQYRITDASGNKVLDRQDTIRTNFYSQNGPSTGTLAHPLAQKIADRVKDAKLQ